VLAVAAFPFAGWAAVAFGAGLVIGSLNGLLARRALGSGLSFRASSLARLGVVSAVAIGVGLLLGSAAAALFGVAVAQLVLALASAVRLVRQ
jgi:hypothetical protein